MAYQGIMDKEERQALHSKLMKAFKYQAKLGNDGCDDRDEDVAAAIEACKLAKNIIRMGVMEVKDHTTLHKKLKGVFNHHIKIANDGADSKEDDINAAKAANLAAETLLDLDQYAKLRGFVPPIQ